MHLASDGDEPEAAPIAPAPHHHHVAGAASASTAAMCTKATPGKTELSFTAFRAAEKRYKLYKADKKQGRRHAPETDFSAVVDCRDLAAARAAGHALHAFPAPAPADAAAGGAAVFAPTIAVFAETVPGLVVFPDAVPVATQRRFCAECIADYSKSPPHPNNLSTLDSERTTDGYVAGLRWATVGYAYNWTEKTYYPDAASPFPPLVAAVSRAVVATLQRVATVAADAAAAAAAAADAAAPTEPADGGDVGTSTAMTVATLRATAKACDGYDPQTAIVNYYPLGSMMMAHQDISEVCLEKPLVSVSLGCSCVFLMGTESRDDAPTAFFLRSGDVAVFTGPSRLAYHAVPRILDDLPAHLAPPPPPVAGEAAEGASDADDAAWRAVAHQLPGLRLNINVRQVYPVPDAAAATMRPQ